MKMTPLIIECRWRQPVTSEWRQILLSNCHIFLNRQWRRPLLCTSFSKLKRIYVVFLVTIPRAKRQAEVTTLTPEPVTSAPGDEEVTTDTPVIDGGDGEDTTDPTTVEGETLTVSIKS